MRRFKGDFGDAADFALAVFHGVVAFALAVFQRADAARFAEINVAGELAHDEDVQTGHHFGLERGSVGQLFVQHGRAQVGKQIQVFANRQQAALGAQGAIERVVLRTADGAEQHGIGGAAQLLRKLGIGVAVFVVGRAAERGVSVGGVQAAGNQLVEYAHGLGGDFGADAVAGQDGDLVGHLVLLRLVENRQQAA